MEDFFDNILEFMMFKIIMPVLTIVLAGLIIAAPFGIYGCVQNEKKPTFELKKDEWSCTKVYEYQTTTHVMVGKILVPQTITHKDCINWSKR